ncbi:glycosyltransferase [Aeromonas allosaccharophila]|uniref:glycosyltransferase n=1 Tax=Aeromonas allosaccharophila TaxID=656 RepID=UPI0013C8D8D7|nr:glycosyltransferase [Aeromonas allosaccharophila]WDO03842.1 glycosyltransferase [Aeromonas allosaccharophila]
MSKIRILIFGTGGLYLRLKDIVFSHYEVVAFYDNDTRKRGQYLDGREIRYVDDGFPDDFQFILVASMYFSDIRNQLLAAGICDAKIKNINFDKLIGRDLLVSKQTSIYRKKKEILEKMKGSLLVIINTLRAGGAERSLVNLLELLAARDVSVNVISLYGGGVYSSQINHPHVHVELFPPEEDIAGKLIVNTTPDFHEMVIDKSFDVVISFLEGHATLIGASISARKKIAWCHTNLKTYHWTSNFFASDAVEQACYNKFDEIVFVSQSGLTGFCELYPDIKVHKSVIPNVFNTSQIIELAREPVVFSGFTFISVGRLTAVKGFDRLIEAFADVCQRVAIEVDLVIIGTGEEHERLNALVSSLGLAARVTLMGYLENPYPYMSAADVYISASHTEGQPLSIGEALILGLPVIATDNQGTSDMLQHGDYGLLVENSVDGLLSGMLRAVNEESFLSEYIARAIEGRSQFSHEKIIKDFLSVID